jgi:hypothetical protein
MKNKRMNFNEALKALKDGKKVRRQNDETGVISPNPFTGILYAYHAIGTTSFPKEQATFTIEDFEAIDWEVIA